MCQFLKYGEISKYSIMFSYTYIPFTINVSHVILRDFQAG